MQQGLKHCCKSIRSARLNPPQLKYQGLYIVAIEHAMKSTDNSLQAQDLKVCIAYKLLGGMMSNRDTGLKKCNIVC